MKYLERANTDLVCWCKCEEGKAISTPPGSGQADCPWCGCGWLFSCTHCRKSFTFARVVERDQSYEEFVTEDRERAGWGFDVEKDIPLIGSIASDLARVMATLKIGEEYVIIDGLVLPAKDPVAEVRGTVGLHLFLTGTPQCLARDGTNAVPLRSLRDPRYWDAARARAVAKQRVTGGVL